jgi:processive 1,2-diacylglycerol beta-glucosyltransferase
MRIKHGLDVDRTTLLLSAGGEGKATLDQTVELLKQLKHRCQVVAICGNNRQMKEKLDHAARDFTPDGRVTLKPIGFTHDMDEYMSAADLLIGKTGGITVSESLAKGLVMVIFNPIPRQEERNSDFMLENGAAVRCNNLLLLPYKIDSLLDDPDRLNQMKQRALQLAQPNAAEKIVTKLLEIFC